MKKLLFILGCTLAASGAFAQSKIVADKIVGIVGDKIILQSDIINAVADMSRQGGTVPENAPCTVLEQALVSKVLMLQAMKDSLPISEEEIEAELDQRVRYFVAQFGSKEAVESVANKSIYQIKDEARESVRENKLATSMQRKIVDGIKITPTEVKAYYDRLPKDSLPFFESEVEVGQIVVYPKASQDLAKYVMDELATLKKQIESKQITFDQAAKKYSEDPGSKERGQFEINRNEKHWDPTFLSTAFRLKDGEISNVIKSKFGYHIILMIRRSGDDAVVSHILRIPPVTDAEMKEGIARLDSVRAKLVEGTIDFNSAAGKYSDDEQAKFAGPFIISRDGDSYNTIDELDKDIVAVLDKIKVGEYSQPMMFADERGKRGVRILYLKSKTEPHRLNLRDDYNKISNAALEEKKCLALDKWLKANLPSYYIMVDDSSNSCPQLKRFTEGRKNYASK